MPFCTQCGAKIDEKAVICPSCGAQQVNANTSNANYNFNAGFTPPPSPNNSFMGDDLTQMFDPNDVQQNKVLSVFAYLGILFLIPLLAVPNSRFARFHVNQGLVLFLFDIASGIIVGIVSAIFIWTPIVGSIIIWLISSIFTIGALILTILGIMNAATGKAKELPLIGKIKLIK